MLTIHRAGLCCLAAAAFTLATAGEAADPDEGADPGAAVRRFQVADPQFAVRLNDLGRTRERYAETPYAAFLATPSGTALAAMLMVGKQELEGETPGVITDALAAVESGMICMQLGPGDFGDMGPEPTIQAALAFTDPGRLFALTDKFQVLEAVAGSEPPKWRFPHERDFVIERHGNVLAMAGRPHGMDAVARLEHAPLPLDPENHLEATADFDPIYVGIKGMIESGQMPPDLKVEHLKMLEGLSFSISARLTSFGILERITYRQPLIEEMLQGVENNVDGSVFTTLPATTVWAVAWASDPALTRKSMDLIPEPLRQEVFAEMDRELATVGLPAYEDLICSFDGAGLLYLEAVDGSPVFTAEQAMNEETGLDLAKVITERTADAHIEPEVEQMLGYAPAVHAAYIDGKLIITTHPEGLAGVTGRSGGFTDQEAVQAALAKLPATAMSMGVANSPASWRLVGEQVLRGLRSDAESAVYAEQLASLPDDLAASAELGYLVAGRESDGTLYTESGGMLSIFTGWIGGYAGMGAYMWWQFEQMRRRMEDMAPPPGGVAPPAPPPTF